MQQTSRAWLVRAGRHGEREALALDQGLALVGWRELEDLSGIKTRQNLVKLLEATYPEAGSGRLANWAGQLWAFLDRIQLDDLVVLPLKHTPAIAIGRVTGPYTYRPDLPQDARHVRAVTWLRPDLPRTAVGQDLLYSLGAFLTVCELRRNQAAQRLAALASTGKDPGMAVGVDAPVDSGDVTDTETTGVDFERLAQDRISAYIAQHFTGHGLARLVEALFQARGMATFRSPEGPDAGIDVLAGSGPLGMDPPRICVQVKSGGTQVDVRIVRELQGVLSRIGADQGLVVAWAGLTKRAEAEVRNQFFQVRVWTADDLIRELTEAYEQLPDDLQAELPLKRVWTLVSGDDSEA
jgi:restriction system protein